MCHDFTGDSGTQSQHQPLLPILELIALPADPIFEQLPNNNNELSQSAGSKEGLRSN